ncbi:MAG: FAD-dependent oxidoreductase [Saprospiraceae bacterium]|nr:FAD-dependent oxidoreductase [Saprospiraceae bacterium]
MQEKEKVIIIGAGIAGLTAAIELEKNGFSPMIYEASDKVGGRVKTDHIDGYRLDHGFQVLLTAYPEAQQYLNYEALDLKTFFPGAVIYDGNETFALSDPLRQPSTLFTMLMSPVGTFSDKIKMWSMSRMLKKKSLDQIFMENEMSTLQYLKDYGFTEKIINHFFKPFFSGIFLENELSTSSRMFEFVFKMFSEGNAAIPAKGMQEIPNQLFTQLKNTQIHFNKKVDRVEGQRIISVDGEKVEADKIIIATDPYKILPGLSSQTQEYHAVVNLYFSVDQSVIQKPLIGLVSKKDALINNFNYMTDVSKDYAPENKCLLSISIVKDTHLKGEELINRVKEEFSRLTGEDHNTMQFLKMYHIRKALPVLDDIQTDIQPTATRIQSKVFLAGDYLLNGSLNAAMVSGRSAAMAAIST